MSNSVTPSNSTNLKTDLPPEAAGLSEEERQEIFSEIDEAAIGSRIDTQRDIFSFTPEKRGAFFPLAVNIIALILVAGGIFYADRFFSRQEEQLNVASDAYLSTEGKIIEEFKKESERRLQEKEGEIEEIQKNLEQIAKERETLALNMEDQIEQREAQLRTAMEAELEAERRRLEARGVSEEELQSRLEEFERERREEFEESLAEYRNEMQRELQEKEQELAEARETAEQILEEARREREELIEETEQREQELRSEFEEERERLSEESERVRSELERLSEVRQNEQLILDQIQSMYLNVKTALEEGDAQAALERIEGVRELINSPSVSRMSNLSKRREVDNFLLNTLEEYVNKTQRSSGEASLLDSAKLLSSAKAAVETAIEAREEGDIYTAQRYFTQALATIPELKTAHEEISRIDGLNRAERIDELFTLAGEEIEEGNLEEAVERLSSAAAEASVHNSAKAREAAERIAELLRTSYESRIEEMETAIENTESELEAVKAELAEKEAELVETRSRLEEELEAAKAELAEKETELEETKETLASERESLGSRISSLEEEIETLRREKEQAENTIDQLENEKAELQQQYAESVKRIDTLEQELDEAATEIASLLSETSGSTMLNEAVNSYTDFREDQRDLVSSEDPEDRERAQRRFENFLESEEINELFPGMSELYRQSLREE